MEGTADSQRWHELLTTRFVCEICLTRFFVVHRVCPARHRIGPIRPRVTILLSAARDDAELRGMMARGQRVMPEEPAAGGDAGI